MIEIEQKQLYQQWNSSLIGMRRRDEALVAVVAKTRKAQQRVKELETELDGYKKSIQAGVNFGYVAGICTGGANNCGCIFPNSCGRTIFICGCTFFLENFFNDYIVIINLKLVIFIQKIINPKINQKISKFSNFKFQMQLIFD